MKLTKQEKSWVLYDVANSAFILIITATLPIYFRSIASSAGVADNVISAWWGTATSVSLLVLAFLSPFLGALADYKGYKKRLFTLFLMIAVLAAFAFTFANEWQAFIILYIISRLGYSACNIFYDGMLVDVTTNERMDHVSSLGYAYGYVGSTIPFILGVILIFFADTFGISTGLATKLSFIIVIVWWLVLSIPLLKNVEQVHYLEHQPQLVKTSIKRVFKTLRDIRQTPKLMYYILAYFFYIDGVYTIISMATTYGGEVGISDNQMLMALLLTQFVAFPFAILSVKLAKRFGTLPVIKSYILLYMFIAIFGFFLQYAWQFWFLAILIGIAQGGIQSLSRSYFGQMIPKEKSNEYFGFFDIFGKFADFMGPLVIAASSILLGESRYGVLFLVVLFIIGYILLGKVQKIDTHEKDVK
ncbi:MFS transporter [Erysipelothrix sp. HDW6C]|uniref:MFS transporter n=1 Tax=Erysipelothrix sp. HDW6C TaxID=2714930 RepID=UPI00140CE8BB|nr:MFS transporter [Erysipelothrix sp. HDW6C]QIK70467.1 MFS transporter [Erysipelothrix sp. HDW6C]